jgi:predicted DNA binding CopG/RHH family protein
MIVKTEVIQIRVSPRLLERIDAKAAMAGMNRSEYCRAELEFSHIIKENDLLRRTGKGM